MGGFEPMDIEADERDEDRQQQQFGNNNKGEGGDPSGTGADDSTYGQVWQGKKEGVLLLTSGGMSFRLQQQQQQQEEDSSGNGGAAAISVSWCDIQKHQLSPATYRRSLLKLVLSSGGGGGGGGGGNNSGSQNGSSSITFEFPNRQELERIRADVTERLKRYRAAGGTSASAAATPVSTPPPNAGKKRPISELTSSGGRSGGGDNHDGRKQSTFGQLDPTALAVTRSSLLAANSALRQQHKHLVEESETVSEEDFWKTHEHLVEEEYARISGCARAGTSSLLQSHLPSSGRVSLGVEEMRQIFVLNPAVHKAYEEKVPLELSDEQFWRRYLESEYFHRDRGRIGTAARNHAPSDQLQKRQQQQQQGKKKPSGPTMEEQDARAAAVGTDDLFSRYDQKLKEQQRKAEAAAPAGGDRLRHVGGRDLAVGQFDLASTFETERGNVLEGPKDNHPPNQTDDGKGSRVIQKYNRHWAMVLHPDEAVAGVNLMQVARRSVADALPDDPDPMAGGGVDEETRRLVDFASATEEDADHASGVGRHDDYEPLTLQNVEAYYAGQVSKSKQAATETDDEAAKKHAIFAKAMAAKVDALVQKSMNKKSSLPQSCFPPPAFGRELLSALTKKMAQDSQTEAASLEMVNKLPEDFRKKLQTYFRRSSELLRHFFGLRKLSEVGGSNSSTSSAHNQKLARIVLGMEKFYREMEGFRRGLPQTETGQLMSKMCLPIMHQLDWAFKLHRERSGGGGGGGFVDVEG